MIDKAQLSELYLNGMSLGDIGKYYNVSRQRIQQIIKAMGIHRDRINKHSWVDDETIIDKINNYRFVDGLKWKEVAYRLSIPLHQIKLIDTGKYPLFNNEKRKCTRCKKILQLNEFHKYHRTKIGLMNYCKKCNYENVKKYLIIRRENKLDRD